MRIGDYQHVPCLAGKYFKMLGCIVDYSFRQITVGLCYYTFKYTISTLLVFNNPIALASIE